MPNWPRYLLRSHRPGSTASFAVSVRRGACGAASQPHRRKYRSRARRAAGRRGSDFEGFGRIRTALSPGDGERAGTFGTSLDSHGSESPCPRHHLLLWTGSSSRTSAESAAGGQPVAVKGEFSYDGTHGGLSVVVADIVTVGAGRYQQTDERGRELLADERLMTPTDVGRVVPDVVALTEDLTALGTRLDTAYPTVVHGRLGPMADRLDRAYRDRVMTRLRTLRTALGRAYETHRAQRLTATDERLETAWDRLGRQRAYRRQTDRYQRQRRRLVAALILFRLTVVALAGNILT